MLVWFLFQCKLAVTVRLPAVEETILKRKKRIDAAQARQARAHLRAKKVLILQLEFIVTRICVYIYIIVYIHI